LRAELSVQQEHEDALGDGGVFGHRGGDQELGHFRKRNALLHVAPLGEEVPDLVVNGLLLGTDGQEQNGFWARSGEELPGFRRRCGIFTGEAFGKIFGGALEFAPAFDEAFAWDGLLDFVAVFSASLEVRKWRTAGEGSVQ